MHMAKLGECALNRLAAQFQPIDQRRPVTHQRFVRHLDLIVLGCLAARQPHQPRVGQPAKHALDPVDAVALIRAAGGVCVLAHPGMWGDQSSVPYALIGTMAAAGMRGLEVDHPDHTPEATEHYRRLAAELDLVATGGSDCHGVRYDPVRLGTSLCDPEAFDALRAVVSG